MAEQLSEWPDEETAVTEASLEEVATMLAQAAEEEVDIVLHPSEAEAIVQYFGQVEDQLFAQQAILEFLRDLFIHRLSFGGLRPPRDEGREDTVPESRGSDAEPTAEQE